MALGQDDAGGALGIEIRADLPKRLDVGDVCERSYGVATAGAMGAAGTLGNSDVSVLVRTRTWSPRGLNVAI